MKRLKIAVIGGGSSYTPELIDSFIKYSSHLHKEIHLVDIPKGKWKLDIITELATRMVEKARAKIKIVSTLDRRSAIKDADFIITQFRVGGLEVRAHDEAIPLKYNVVGQETIGPGGFALALRSIPVILEICREIETLAPQAWLINFTNPAGLITEVIHKYTNVKVIGLCNLPVKSKKMMARLMNVNEKNIAIDFVGLNHLIWGRKIRINGEDVTSQVLRQIGCKYSAGASKFQTMGWEEQLVDSQEMLPCLYHQYYYTPEKIISSQRKLGLRATQVQLIEKQLFEKYNDPNLHEIPCQLEERGGTYYSEAAVALIDSIYNNRKELHVINVKNNGTIEGLSNDAIVEVTCMVDETGGHPIQVGSLSPKISGLIQQVKSYEEFTVEAGVNGDYQMALKALSMHPLVPFTDVAKKILDEILMINQPYLPQFN